MRAPRHLLRSLTLTSAIAVASFTGVAPSTGAAHPDPSPAHAARPSADPTTVVAVAGPGTVLRRPCRPDDLDAPVPHQLLPPGPRCRAGARAPAPGRCGGLDPGRAAAGRARHLRPAVAGPGPGHRADPAHGLGQRVGRPGRDARHLPVVVGRPGGDLVGAHQGVELLRRRRCGPGRCRWLLDDGRADRRPHRPRAGGLHDADDPGGRPPAERQAGQPRRDGARHGRCGEDAGLRLLLDVRRVRPPRCDVRPRPGHPGLRGRQRRHPAGGRG